MFRSNLAELEAGFQVIASSHKRDRWHLLPCLTLLVLAVLFMHPGRVKALRAEFDRSRFPADAATFLSGQQTDHSIRLYSSWQWGGYLIYRLWPSLRVFDDGRTDFYGPPCVCRRRTASLGRMPGLGWYLRAVPRERRAPSGGFGPGHCIARETRLEACLQGPDCSVV